MRSPETKAAVLAALLEGQAVTDVARRWSLPKSTVGTWKAELESERIRTKNDRIGELLLGYLEANLETLRVQVEFFRDKVWLEKQDASEVAVLHGVVTDKAVRLLEALQAGAELAASADRRSIEAGVSAN